MALRLRRLRSDERALRQLEAASTWLRILEFQGAPAERYRLEYHVPGLVVEGQNIARTERHLVEIYLTLAYPRQAPQCRMLTPVFHPNIAPHAICIGDHWTAGESLAALVVRIAEMLSFQSYNVKSPLNGQAARWADEHATELPLASTDFGVELREREEAAAMEEEESAAAASPVVEVPVMETPMPPAVPLAAARSEGGLTCGACGAAFTVGPAVRQLWVRCPICGRAVAT